MSWVAIALIGAALFGIVSVLDKRILMNHVPGLPAFYFVLALLQVPMAIGTALVQPWDGGASTEAMIAAIATGTFWGVALLLLFYGLRALEVSRIVPIFHTFPVFTAVMAVLFLDEELLLVHWLAILAVVIGAGSIVLGQGQGRGHDRKYRVYALVFLGSLFMGAATVTNKTALEGMNFWNVFALRQGMVGVVALLPSLRPGIVSQIKRQLADRQGMALLIFTEGPLVFVVHYLILVALDRGSASVVATLIATRPFFVLVYSALLSTPVWCILDEPLSRDTLALKVASTAMIIGGVGVLTLV